MRRAQEAGEYHPKGYNPTKPTWHIPPYTRTLPISHVFSITQNITTRPVHVRTPPTTRETVIPHQPRGRTFESKKPRRSPQPHYVAHDAKERTRNEKEKPHVPKQANHRQNYHHHPLTLALPHVVHDRRVCPVPAKQIDHTPQPSGQRAPLNPPPTSWQ